MGLSKTIQSFMVLCSSVSVKGEIPCIVYIYVVIMVVNPNIAIKANE